MNEPIRVLSAEAVKNAVVSIETTSAGYLAHVFMGGTPRAQFSIEYFGKTLLDARTSVKELFPLAKIEIQ